ncbi:hypothetical protein U879_07955 [Defluviimonas sp. 20V17]|nr:hypothetical protein U879_07955 [Defluviimonas sp. 20V17]
MAAAQSGHFWFVIIAMLVVVVPVFILTPIILWRYRYGRRNASYRPEWSFSWGWEILLWGGPIVLILILGTVLWAETGQLDPYKPLGPHPLRVDVVGYDWKWLFIYPDLGIATVDKLEIPVGRPVALRLTSDTVMQSFLIPALAGQIYAMQGMRTKLNLEASQAGAFLGENTQYNGTGFHAQKFTTTAASADDFRKWVGSARAGAHALSPAVIHALETKGTDKDMARGLHLGGPSDLVFRLPVADLFTRILRDGPAAPAHALLAGSPIAAPAAPKQKAD